MAAVEWATRRGERAVRTRVRVWQRAGRRRRGCTPTAGGGGGAEGRRARRRYRERFGIETSYRQKNQAGGWTTSADPAYRLLLEGLALVVRQVWVVLALAIARARGHGPTAWVGERVLADVLEWLADPLRTVYPITRRLRLPLPPLTTRPAR